MRHRQVQTSVDAIPAIGGYTIEGKSGKAFVFTAAELGRLGLSAAGLTLGAETWANIAETTSTRIRDRIDVSLAEAIRFGVFSYLLEVIQASPDGGDEARGSAVKIANAFQQLNSVPESEALSETDLAHFAHVIQSNSYSWEGLLIAYLDPEAAKIDRLRQNLRLTPTERWQRHSNLQRQLQNVKRA